MQNNKQHLRNILELNLAMLFISTSGALGRYIDMPVPVTIAFRAILAGGLLFLFCKWKKISFRIATKDRATIIAGGVLMGLHWVTYFYALKMSNVAIGMLSLFTYPVITSFLEPILLKTKFQKMHLVLGALVLLGIYFLVPDFSVENSYAKAVGFGVISALCYALRNLIMKTKVGNYHGSMLMWYQLVIISVLLSPFLFVMDSSGITTQWPWILVLALLTTAIGHTLFLFSLKRFSATTASIISSIQPVYGIIIGIVFLKEIPLWTTIIGGVLILTSVVIESIRSYR
ncbi:DMT family transporter [Aquimarina sp. 2201CG14-23]|uniref:DMT family transporter n=1 Tax=Aquimarina mycalae TaxID=3040073 RepID=UPI002478168F|nr:DMT family transporter [Aquimarina sp. 2201CG14-23]MDH7444016.1 DMT family transporter [Aquimarina sp. 2201CG14-23]